MENLNKTQKIVLYIVGGLVIVLIIIYFFTRDNTIYSDYNNLYLEENIIQENNIEETKNLIYIYITGEVNSPSVLELPEGARIKDAIEKAGGLTDSGEIKEINLAYKLNDGEKLYIPSLDEVIESKENNTSIQYISTGIINNATSNNISVSDDNSNFSSSNSNGLININTCTQTELETLDGIGPSTAKKIIDYRKENGKFNSIESIKDVSGIGEAKYEGIKDNICVK